MKDEKHELIQEYEQKRTSPESRKPSAVPQHNKQKKPCTFEGYRALCQKKGTVSSLIHASNL